MLLVCCAVALILGANPGSEQVWNLHSPVTLISLLLQGLLVLPISFSLLTLAPRYLTAPEVSLFLLIGMLWDLMPFITTHDG
jgi:hypothetical protein